MRRLLTAIVFAALLVLVVVGCASSGSSTETPASAPATTPAATDTGAPDGSGAGVDGAAVFADNCAGCHGSDGSGGSGPNLQGEDNTAKVVEQVTAGGDSMPAFDGQLSAVEIQAVADYVTGGLQ